MAAIEANIETAGAYVLYEGYFVFMFGFGSHHPANELGIVRFGGHREAGETAIECVRREVKEESSLDVTFFENQAIYMENDHGNGYDRTKGSQRVHPILISRREENRFSAMYLAHGHGSLVPGAETQGVLFLRREDLGMICSRDTTLREYTENGGKLLLAGDLPESAVLSPHTQIRFLNRLFTLEEKLLTDYTASYEN